MSWFFMIPFNELTQQMINLSTSRDKQSIPIQTFSNQDFYVLEVASGIETDRVFSSYRKYLAKELGSASPIIPGDNSILEGIAGLSGIAKANKATDFQYVIPGDRLLEKIILGIKGSNFLDSISFSVSNNKIHINGLYVIDGYSEVVFNPKIFIASGTTMKLSYSNVGLVDANVFVNLRWNKE